MTIQQTEQTVAPTTEELLAEYAEINRRIQDDLDRLAEIEDTFREYKVGTYETEHGSVRVSSQRRFNANIALELMSERSKKRVMVEKVDARLVKKHFPGIHRRSQVRYDNKVYIDVE